MMKTRETTLPMENSCAILISRQPLRPSRSTPWVTAAADAVGWVKKRGFSLYTSVGMQTWEFLVFLARKEHVAQSIVLPCASGEHFERLRQNVIDQFALEGLPVDFFPASESLSGKNVKKLLFARDAKITSLAKLLIPLSVRPKGHMSKMIHDAIKKDNCSVTNRFEINYQKRTRPISYRIDPEKVSKALFSLDRRYLIHWTRGANGPWPTEKRIDYYRDIFRSDFYPRDALATLKNILKTGCIKSTSTHMPARASTVCFSGLPPIDALSLMRWRARYVQMSFEPYGVGIERETAGKLGVLPACYHKGKKAPDGIEPWRLQSEGNKGNWPAEDEFRCLGDFPFSEVPPEKRVCFCKTPIEAAEIEKQFGIETYPLLRPECT